MYFHERNPGVTQSWKIASDFLSPEVSGQVVQLIVSSIVFLLQATISKPFLVSIWSHKFSV
jgi:hypothetical protein